MKRSTVALALGALTLAGASYAQESKVALEDGAGRDKVQQCVACHSLDYIQMNSRFLDKAGWTATVNKMINAFAAPIPKDDVDTLATYLAAHYGRPQEK